MFARSRGPPKQELQVQVFPSLSFSRHTRVHTLEPRAFSYTFCFSEAAWSTLVAHLKAHRGANSREQRRGSRYPSWEALSFFFCPSNSFLCFLRFPFDISRRKSFSVSSHRHATAASQSCFWYLISDMRDCSLSPFGSEFVTSSSQQGAANTLGLGLKLLGLTLLHWAK